MDYLLFGKLIAEARNASVCDPEHDAALKRVAITFCQTMANADAMTWQERDALMVATGFRDPS